MKGFSGWTFKPLIKTGLKAGLKLTMAPGVGKRNGNPVGSKAGERAKAGGRVIDVPKNSITPRCIKYGA